MIYAVDSNVVLKWVFIEADTPKARQLRTDFQNGIHQLLSPDVLLSECRPRAHPSGTPGR